MKGGVTPDGDVSIGKIVVDGADHADQDEMAGRGRGGGEEGDEGDHGGGGGEGATLFVGLSLHGCEVLRPLFPQDVRPSETPIPSDHNQDGDASLNGMPQYKI